MVESEYQRRPIRFLELWAIAGFRLKAYSIAFGRDVARRELVEAAHRIIEHGLNDHPTRNQHYGVGFVGIHDGRGENQVFLDIWINQNELLHTFWISATDDPSKLARAPEDHNSVCVWDLHLQHIERDAWIECVIGNPQGADLDAYLARRFNGSA